MPRKLERTKIEIYFFVTCQLISVFCSLSAESKVETYYKDYVILNATTQTTVVATEGACLLACLTKPSCTAASVSPQGSQLYCSLILNSTFRLVAQTGGKTFTFCTCESQVCNIFARFIKAFKIMFYE